MGLADRLRPSRASTAPEVCVDASSSPKGNAHLSKNLKSSRTVFGRATKPEHLQTPAGEHIYRTKIVGSGADCNLILKITSKRQHTVSWELAMHLPAAASGKEPSETLEAGSCNLYQFPKVQFSKQWSSHRPGASATEPPRALAGPLLATLRRALLAVFLDDNDALELVDGAGAKPIHALLLANTAAAVQLAMRLLIARPRLMLQAHVGQPFEGENVLHVLIVNRREDAVCQLVTQAFELFGREELESLLWGQATGSFFKDEPMLFYGGTLVSYATAFSLERAIVAMLVGSTEWRRRMRREGTDQGSLPDLVDPNGEAIACQRTGFLPLHVAVANGLASMFNFWVDLPPLGIEFDHLRAHNARRSHVGGQPGYSRLTPLQAAVKLGDHRMVQYIVRCESKTIWVWGPITCFHLDLEGIDSCGETNNDVMELVAIIGAGLNTQQMMLDDFMMGLLHTLFAQKWDRFGRRLHIVMRGFDFVYLVLLIQLLMHMKHSPHTVEHELPAYVLFSMLPIVEEDARASYLWWKSFRASSGKDGYPDTAEIVHLLEWMNSHQMITRFCGFMLTLPSCFVIASEDYSDWSNEDLRNGQHFDALWVPMAFALFIHVQNFARSTLAPYEKLGIIYLAVFKMLASDVTLFIFLFVIFLLNYGVAMYISYPQAGPQTLPMVVEFNEPLDALNSLVTLGFTGDPIILNLDRTELAKLTAAEAIDFLFFVFFYLFYIIMSMILLLNLLIAMMGDTFSSTMAISTLEWRIDFARRVLRLEIQTRALVQPSRLHAGEQVGDVWVHEYKKYAANEEGGGRLRGGEGSMFAADVEAEAEEDALDDDKVVGDDTQSMLLQDMADEDEWASRPGTPRHELLKQEVVRQQQQQELAKRPLPKLRRAVTRQLATKMITGANKQLRSMRELHEGQIAAERESARAAGMDGTPAPGPAAACGPTGSEKEAKEAQVT